MTHSEGNSYRMVAELHDHVAFAVVERRAKQVDDVWVRKARQQLGFVLHAMLAQLRGSCVEVPKMQTCQSVSLPVHTYLFDRDLHAIKGAFVHWGVATHAATPARHQSESVEMHARVDSCARICLFCDPSL